MTDPTNDIEQLLRWLDAYDKSIPQSQHRWHAALVALVADRDALKQENDAIRSQCKAAQDEVLDRVFEMKKLRERIWKLSAQQSADRDRDLRERLVCAALTGLCSDPSVDMDESGSRAAVAIADRTLAAMRKGGGDGK